MKDLNELKEQMTKYCERHASRGGNITTWQCPSCNKQNQTTSPSEHGELWSSSTTCYECGKTSVVAKTVDNITVTLMPV